jgi:hypothetical protein
LPQDVRETIGEPVQITVTKILHLPLFAKPAQSQMIAPRAFRVTINAFISYIEPPIPRKAVKLASHRVPGELFTGSLVVQQIRDNAPSLMRLLDCLPRHLDFLHAVTLDAKTTSSVAPELPQKPRQGST